MKKLIKPTTSLLLLIGWILTFNIQSQAQTTYSTINIGAWTDLGVWSLDGTTACGCFPSFTIDGFNVKIQHVIDQNQNIFITAGDSLFIEPNGYLGTTTYRSVIESGGFVQNNGGFVNKRFTIDAGGELFNYDYMRVVAGSMDLYGDLNILGGELKVDMGNIYVYPGGNLNLVSSLIRYDAGNLQIEGTLNLDGSCVYFDGGNARNYASGIVSGNGSIETAGNIRNEGYWDENVTWCAGGASIGLPTAPDCSGTTACETFLPVELVYFRGRGLEEAVLIEWATSMEKNNDHFTIRKSVDALNFTELTTVKAAGNSSETNKYQFLDTDPTNGIAWYQLSQTDIEGSETRFEIIAVVFDKGDHSTLTIYPNPATDQANFVIEAVEENYVIQVTDLNGYVVREITPDYATNQFTMDVSGMVPGMYMVRMNSTNGTAVQQKLIIR